MEGQQLVGAFPSDGWILRFLQRDRNGMFGWAFRRKVQAMGIEKLISVPRSPWQNPFVEHLIGSIRRECTGHIIPRGEKHLLRALREYQAYFDESRTHDSLDGSAPIARQVQAAGEMIATSVLGGLHHQNSRGA